MISKVLRIKIQILWLCFACPLLVTEISVYIRIYGSFLLLTVYDVYKHDVGNSSNIFSFMFCTALKFVSILYEDLDRSLFKFIFLFALYQFLLITVLCIWRRKWQPTPVFLPREACGQRSLVGLSIGSHRVRHNWATFIIIIIPHRKKEPHTPASMSSCFSRYTQKWLLLKWYYKGSYMWVITRLTGVREI